MRCCREDGSRGIIGDQEYTLEAGDSIYYASSIPHRWENAGDGRGEGGLGDHPPLVSDRNHQRLTTRHTGDSAAGACFATSHNPKEDSRWRVSQAKGLARVLPSLMTSASRFTRPSFESSIWEACAVMTRVQPSCTRKSAVRLKTTGRLIKIPEPVIDAAFKTCPDDFTIYGRESMNDVAIGKAEVHFATMTRGATSATSEQASGVRSPARTPSTEPGWRTRSTTFTASTSP